MSIQGGEKKSNSISALSKTDLCGSRRGLGGAGGQKQEWKSMCKVVIVARSLCLQ